MTIKVNELIARLEKLDPDLDVWVEDGASDSGYAPATGVGEVFNDELGGSDPEAFVAIWVE